MKNLLVLAVSVCSLFFSICTAQAQTEKPAKVGRMNTADFEQRVAKGRDQLAALVVNKVALQTQDLKTVNKLAISVQRQLAAALAAKNKLANPELQLLAAEQAQAQQTLWTLLQKMSVEKKFSLPSAAEAKAPQQTEKINELSGKALEKAFVVESAQKGTADQLELLMEAKTGTEANFKTMAGQAMNMLKPIAQVADQLQLRMFPIPVY